MASRYPSLTRTSMPWTCTPFCMLLLSLIGHGKLVHEWYITIGDFLDKTHIRIEQHDMEMLDSVDTLYACPVPEPCYMLRSDFGAERPPNIFIYPSSPSLCQVTLLRIFLHLEPCPYDQMHNTLVYTVWPVIVQNLDVIYTRYQLVVTLE